MFWTEVFHIYVLDRGVPYLGSGQSVQLHNTTPNVLYRGVSYLTFWTEVFHILHSGQRCSISYILDRGVLYLTLWAEVFHTFCSEERYSA